VLAGSCRAHHHAWNWATLGVVAVRVHHHRGVEPEANTLGKARVEEDGLLNRCFKPALTLPPFLRIGYGSARLEFGLQVPQQQVNGWNVRHGPTCSTSVFNPREQPHEAEASGQGMVPVVVVKLGGGLITEKAMLTTSKSEVIHRLATEVAEAERHGVRVVVVHGAGSFGHLRAKQWALAEGRSDAVGGDECTSQDDAVERVREDMMLLSREVCSALGAAGLTTSSHPPHAWAEGTGPSFRGDVLRLVPNHSTPVTWGDVVPVQGPKEFGILSGDDLVYRCAMDVPHVVRVVFVMGGAHGVLRRPPVAGVPQELITVWSENEGYVGHHASEIDVTGGIGLKVQRAQSIASAGIETYFVNGEVAGRLRAAVLGKDVRGTRFPPAQKG